MSAEASTKGGAVVRDDGGDAFPLSTIDGYSQYGMSLRDYFAAKAMQALVSGRTWGHIEPDALMATWANGAYQLADAMLAARQEGSTT